MSLQFLIFGALTLGVIAVLAWLGQRKLAKWQELLSCAKENVPSINSTAEAERAAFESARRAGEALKQHRDLEDWSDGLIGLATSSYYYLQQTDE